MLKHLIQLKNYIQIVLMSTYKIFELTVFCCNNRGGEKTARVTPALPVSRRNTTIIWDWELCSSCRVFDANLHSVSVSAPWCKGQCTFSAVLDIFTHTKKSTWFICILSHPMYDCFFLKQNCNSIVKGSTSRTPCSAWAPPGRTSSAARLGSMFAMGGGGI